MNAERRARQTLAIAAAGLVALVPIVPLPGTAPVAEVDGARLVDASQADLTLRRAVAVGTDRRFVVTARRTTRASGCVSNGDPRAVRVSIALERLYGRRAQRRFAVREIRVLADGELQRIHRDAPAVLRRGVLHWQTRTPGGTPWRSAGRHVGSIELVTSSRPPGSRRDIVRRVRLSLPFFVCM